MNHSARAALSIGLVAAVAIALGGCSKDPSAAEYVAGVLPDLSTRGYVSFDCGTGVVLGETFVAPVDGVHVANCWKSAPTAGFPFEASSIADEVVVATGGIDVTESACPEDVLNEGAGVACRAIYVGKEGDDVLVRVIVALVDPAGAVAALPEGGSEQEVANALSGLDVEVLIGTEPLDAEQSGAEPSATSN